MIQHQQQTLPVRPEDATVALFPMLDPEHEVFKKIEKEHPEGVIGIARLSEKAREELHARWKLHTKHDNSTHIYLMDKRTVYTAAALDEYYASLDFFAPGCTSSVVIGPEYLCRYIFLKSLKTFSKVYYHKPVEGEFHYLIKASSGGSIDVLPLKKELFV